MEIEDLLYQCSKMHAPSGNEREFAEYLYKTLAHFSDSCHIDSVGNLIAELKGTGDERIMISAHMDEIGFMVSYIDDNGYVYFNKIGGVNPSILPGSILYIHHNGELIPAVVGVPSYRKEGGGNVETSYGDLWLDAGFCDREKALLMISVGDYITFKESYQELPDRLIAYKSADNKIGVIIACLLLSRLSIVPRSNTIDFVFSTGEEIGLAGAKYAASILKPNKCIVIDATHATDYPTTNRCMRGEIKLNKGIVLSRGAEIDEKMFAELQEVAGKLMKTYQIEPTPSNSFTEAHEIKTMSRGISTAIVSFPCRYMHSNHEIVSLKDVEDIVEIIHTYCILN